MAQVLPMIPPKPPQAEEGFIRIGNELMDAVLSAGFTQRQMLVLLAIIRKTYGYNKKEDDISSQQIGALVNMARPHVTSTLNQLADMNVISKRPGQYGCIISVQKDTSRWNLAAKNEQKNEQKIVQKPRRILRKVPSTESVQVYQIGTGNSTESVQVDSTKSVHTIDNLPKDNPKRQYICAPHLFDRFYSAYPRKRSRKQAERAFAKLKPDDALVDQMIAAIDKAKSSGRWDDIEFVPYPATWLNAQGWLDDLSTEYTERQKEIIREYNRAMGGLTGEIDETIYSESRAFAIDAFTKLSAKPNFWKVYFPWIAENADLPPHVGFDWLISRDGFTKIKGGQFSREVKKND